MSTYVPSTIECRCGTRYPAEVANGLHISLRPDVRQQIMDGTFHRFFCPSCGMTTQVETVIAFSDFPRRQWFLIAPDADLPRRAYYIGVAEESFRKTMVENAPPMVVEWGKEMTRRVMFGLAALREKLVISDAGLDDRVVELLKIQLCRDVFRDFEPVYFHLAEVTADELVFERAHRDDVIRKAPVPRAMYDDLAGAPELAAAIAQAFPDQLVIDHRAILAPTMEA